MERPCSLEDQDDAQESLELVLQRWLSAQDALSLANCVSHDLVQPLSDIVNRVWVCRELSKRTQDADQLQESLSHIENCALRAVEMIRMAHQLVREQIRTTRPRDCIQGDDTIS